MLGGLCSLMGSTLDRLAEEESAAYFEALNQGIEWAWEKFDWPEICRTDPFSVTVSGARGLIPWMGEGIGTPLAVYESDPLIDSAPQIPFVLQAGEIVVATLDQVWIRYRLRPPRWSSEVYDVATAYAAGDVVYDFASGHGFEALQPTQGRPVSDVAAWRKLEVPYVISRAAKTYAHSVLLGGREGQEGSAAAVRRNAVITLDEAMAIIAIQAHQVSEYR